MAHTLSQDDLDALSPGDATEKHASAEHDASASGITQADLDALWGGIGGGGVEQTSAEKKESAPPGLSQSDLDVLWGLAPEDGRQEPTIAEEPARAPISENLSQDDIDRLLAEMGK